jgi:beta-lactam-binding protein with PASTA domain
VDRGNLVTVPDLLGSNVEEARQVLGATGWEGHLSIDEVPVTDPVQEGKLLHQSVPPGRSIDRSDPLSVSVCTLSGPTPTAAPGG